MINQPANLGAAKYGCLKNRYVYKQIQNIQIHMCNQCSGRSATRKFEWIFQTLDTPAFKSTAMSHVDSPLMENLKQHARRCFDSLTLAAHDIWFLGLRFCTFLIGFHAHSPSWTMDKHWGGKMTTGKKCYSSPLLSTLEKRNLRICMFEDFLRYLKSVIWCYLHSTCICSILEVKYAACIVFTTLRLF